MTAVSEERGAAGSRAAPLFWAQRAVLCLAARRVVPQDEKPQRGARNARSPRLARQHIIHLGERKKCLTHARVCLVCQKKIHIQQFPPHERPQLFHFARRGSCWRLPARRNARSSLCCQVFVFLYSDESETEKYSKMSLT